MFKSSSISVMVLIALAGCQSTEKSVSKDQYNLNKPSGIEVNEMTFSVDFAQPETLITSIDYVSVQESKGQAQYLALKEKWSKDQIEAQNKQLGSTYQNGTFIVRVYGETINSVSRDFYQVDLIQQGDVIQTGVFDAVGDVPSMDYPSRLWRNDSKLATYGLDTSQPFNIRVMFGDQIANYQYSPELKG
ncbi:hypothetical protein [Vibrio ostreicida]|uniref:hypothetical protein n=1 Tax=Vibrio ostreicida TaxID=526588 RepID=UPI0009708115|nr:hypothetical protein [Vibrio ostreicida]